MDEADRGLDSIADLRVLGRLFFYGLVVAVVIGAIVATFTRHWFVLLIVVGAYAAIGIIQWLAVSHRMNGGRDPR